MPKLKTNKTLAKRIKNITKKGKIICKNMSAQHRMHGKNKKIKAKSLKNHSISRADFRRLNKTINK